MSFSARLPKEIPFTTQAEDAPVWIRSPQRRASYFLFRQKAAKNQCARGGDLDTVLVSRLPLPLADRAPARTRTSLCSNMRALLARSAARLRHRQRRRLSLRYRPSMASFGASPDVPLRFPRRGQTEPPGLSIGTPPDQVRAASGGPTGEARGCSEPSMPIGAPRTRRASAKHPEIAVAGVIAGQALDHAAGQQPPIPFGQQQFHVRVRDQVRDLARVGALAVQEVRLGGPAGAAGIAAIGRFGQRDNGCHIFRSGNAEMQRPGRTVPGPRSPVPAVHASSFRTRPMASTRASISASVFQNASDARHVAATP